MESLQQLKYELIQKKEQLDNICVNIFTLNPEIQQLAKDISTLEMKIKVLEEEDNG